MCWNPKNFFCIKLQIGAKIFAILFTIISMLATVLFGTPALLSQTLPDLTRCLYSVLAVMFGSKFLTGIILIYGVFKERPSYMTPWILSALCLSFGLIVLGLAGPIAYVYSEETDYGKAIVMLIYGTYGLFLFYIALTMRTYKEQLLQSNARLTQESRRLKRNLLSTTSVIANTNYNPISEIEHVSNVDGLCEK